MAYLLSLFEAITVQKNTRDNVAALAIFFPEQESESTSVLHT